MPKNSGTGKPSASRSIVRMNLDFDVRTVKTIEHLKADLGASSMTETLRRSVNLHAMLLREIANGAELELHYPDPDRRPVLVLIEGAFKTAEG